MWYIVLQCQIALCYVACKTDANGRSQCAFVFSLFIYVVTEFLGAMVLNTWGSWFCDRFHIFWREYICLYVPASMNRCICVDNFWCPWPSNVDKNKKKTSKRQLIWHIHLIMDKQKQSRDDYRLTICPLKVYFFLCIWQIPTNRHDGHCSSCHFYNRICLKVQVPEEESILIKGQTFKDVDGTSSKYHNQNT